MCVMQGAPARISMQSCMQAQLSVPSGLAAMVLVAP